MTDTKAREEFEKWWDQPEATMSKDIGWAAWQAATDYHRMLSKREAESAKAMDAFIEWWDTVSENTIMSSSSCQYGFTTAWAKLKPSIESQRLALEEKDKRIAYLEVMANNAAGGFAELHERIERLQAAVVEKDAEIERFRVAHVALTGLKNDAEREVEQLKARVKEWQPIESAPKDGTVIDIWANGHRITDVWFDDDDNCWVCGYADNLITHWMPIIEPMITPPGEQKV